MPKNSIVFIFRSLLSFKLQYPGYPLSDSRVDVIITLLSMALNPNFAVHTDGRKLIIDGKSALMHKSSVNCPFGNKGVKFPYKLFVFGEKVRTRAVTARQTTCIRRVF